MSDMGGASQDERLEECFLCLKDILGDVLYYKTKPVDRLCNAAIRAHDFTMNHESKVARDEVMRI